MNWLLAATLFLAGRSSAAPTHRCYLAWGRGDHSESIAAQLIRKSDAVVLAEVIDSTRASDTTDLLRGRRVRLRVREVLRGTNVPSVLTLSGVLAAEDDFNPAANVPYKEARASAQGGSCFAFVYRRGATYLLLLRHTEASLLVGAAPGLSPYWAPLRPTNEQVHDGSDAWVQWVRHEIARETPSRRGV